HGIRGYQRDRLRLVTSGAIDAVPCVEGGELLLIHATRADGVEQGDKRGVLLAIYLGEVEHRIGCRAQGVGIKEIRTGIVGGKQPLFLRQHHRWQLKEIAKEEQLHTTERGASTGAIDT